MFRTGAGWWWPDDWGVWTRPDGGGLSIRVPGPHGALRGFFRIRGIIQGASDWRLDFQSPDGVRPYSGRLGPDERRCIIVDFPPSPRGSTINASLRGGEPQHLALLTDGQDKRQTSIGFEGFYLCDAADFEARVNFTEAMASGDLERLTSGYQWRWSPSEASTPASTVLWNR